MVSVVIPTYNEEKALPETLQVLFRQPGDYEVIIVDGGSTDRTSEIVRGFSLRLQPSALNTFRFLPFPKGRAIQMNGGQRSPRANGCCFFTPILFCPPAPCSG